MAIEWLPMQTAPTDGSKVLLLCPEQRRADGRVVIGKWSANYAAWSNSNGNLVRPSRWATLTTDTSAYDTLTAAREAAEQVRATYTCIRRQLIDTFGDDCLGDLLKLLEAPKC